MKQISKMVSILLLQVAILAIGAGSYAADSSPAATPDRTVLPVQEPKPPLYKELDARNAKMPPNFEVKAPAGAPNVVIILIDDLGFGAPAPSAARSPRRRWIVWRKKGLRYNNFHTTALCSPTRAALKSGRNHHTVNMGFITEMATGFPAPPARSPTRRLRWRKCFA